MRAVLLLLMLRGGSQASSGFCILHMKETRPFVCVCVILQQVSVSPSPQGAKAKVGLEKVFFAPDLFNTLKAKGKKIRVYGDSTEALISASGHKAILDSYTCNCKVSSTV